MFFFVYGVASTPMNREVLLALLYYYYYYYYCYCYCCCYHDYYYYYTSSTCSLARALPLRVAAAQHLMKT